MLRDLSRDECPKTLAVVMFEQMAQFVDDDVPL